MDCFYILLFLLNSSIYTVSCVHLPLLNDVRSPLFVNIDVSSLIKELKGYIYDVVKERVNETCLLKIDTLVTQNHAELKSTLLREMNKTKNDFKHELWLLESNINLRIKQMEKDQRNHNEVFEKQLEERSKEKVDEVKREIYKRFTDIELRLTLLDQNPKKENETSIIKVEKRQNETTKKLMNKIIALEKKVLSDEKRVVLLACIPASELWKERPRNYVWKFDDVRIHTGINNLSSFIKTGKFTCEANGLYLISASIASISFDTYFYIYKNGNQIVRPYVTGNNADEWGSGTGVVALELVVNDKVWISPGKTMYTHTIQTSCVTIVKIK